MSKNIKITDFSMLDDFEVQGEWWLPGEGNDNSLNGTLYLSNENTYLDVQGKFSDVLDENIKYDYIHGLTIKGEKVTLISCIKVKEVLNFPGISHESFSVLYFIVGEFFTDMSQAKFGSAKVVSTYLTEWFSSKPFSTKKKTDEEDESGLYSIIYEKPEVKTFNIPYLDTDITNEPLCTVNHGNGPPTYFYSEYFRITPADPKTFHWFEEKSQSLNKLLAILMNEKANLKRVILENAQEMDQVEGRREVHLYVNQRNNEVKKKISEYNMLFSYRDIKDHLECIFNNWFSKESYLMNVYSLYFNDFILQEQKAALESKFLNIMQVLEVYHRSLGAGKLFDDTEKNRYLNDIDNAIKDSIPDDIREEAIKKLSHFNEYSLNKRLRELKRDLSNETISFLFYSGKKANSLLSKAVSARNHLTHYEDNGESQIEGVNLHYAARLLKVLSAVFLFKELGIEEDKILGNIKDSDKLSQEVNISKAELLNTDSE